MKSRESIRILLVDDHLDTVTFTSLLLARHGHAVFPAYSIKEALQVASEQPIDVLISDIALPDGSGLELLRELKQIYGIKSITLSGKVGDDDQQTAKAAGCDRFLAKPVELQLLLEAIDELAASKG